MNKIEKTIFSIIFAVVALFIIFLSICWMKVSVLLGIMFGVIFIVWGGYAFLNAWYDANEMCRRRHERKESKKGET